MENSSSERSQLREARHWREVENLQSDEPPPDMDVSEAVRDPDTGHMISSVVAAALCIKPRGRLTDRQAGKVNALKQGSTVFAIMRGLAMRFNGILRSRSSEALDEWIDDAHCYRTHGDHALRQRFAPGYRCRQECNRTPLEQRSRKRQATDVIQITPILTDMTCYCTLLTDP